MLLLLRCLSLVRRWVGWLLLAGASLSAPVAAQTYSVTSTAYTWDTVSTAAGLTGDDLVSGAVAMGISFPMGGVNYTQVHFNTNGLVMFASPNAAYVNEALPNVGIPFPALAAYWDDLRTDSSGSNITYGLVGTAPNRRFVISYNNVSLYANTAIRQTFQVALFEDGTIEYRYGAMGAGASATVGVQLGAADATSFAGSPGISTLASQTLRFVAREDSTPGGVSGHVWWSRAGTLTSTVADGGAISTWANAANSAKNLSGSTTRPLLANNNARNINFNPTVAFTSATSSAAGAQYFTAPSFLGSTSRNQTHFFWVAYPTAAASRNYLFWEGQTSARVSAHLPWSDSTVPWTSGDWAGRTASFTPTPSPTNRPVLLSMLKDAAADVATLSARQGVRQNGVVVATRSTSAAFAGNNTSFYLGWQAVESGSATFQGHVAEGIFLLDKVLSSAEVNRVESYLSVKYGLTLGDNGALSTAYLDSAGSTVWAAGSGHHHNVAGIARDDTTRLDQRISRSSNSGDQITVVSNASMASAASTISAQFGTAFTADRAYVVWGDNNADASSTLNVASGSLAGYARSSRVWRVQATGAAPASTTVCIPDTLIPAAIRSSASLQLSLSSAADFSTGVVSLSLSSGSCPGTGVGVTTSVPGRLAVISKAQLETASRVGFMALTARMLDHVEVTTSVSSGVTCSPVTFTVKACGDASCSSTYTGGLTGTLNLAGTGMTVNFPAGAGFTIASGSATTTVQAQVTTAGTVTAGASGLSITPSNATPVFCGIGVAAASGNSCSLTVATAGFLLDVPDHRSGASQTVNLQAVRQSDNAAVCVPAITGTKSVNFKCSYLNPGTGSLPVLVAGTAANASSNAAAACDVTGSSRSLSFDATGTAAIAVQYNDAGQARLTATYTGSGSEAGLVITGSDSFVAVPSSFAIGGYPTTAIAAGVDFAATVTAFNAQGSATPNFGRETVAELPTVSLFRAKPSGSAAVNGSFTVPATPAPVGGVFSFSGLRWSEVGRAEMVTRLSSGSYLGTGLSIFGTTGAMAACAAQGSSCTLPAGTTSTVRFDAGSNRFTFKHGQSGTFSCVAASFPADPNPAASKTCTLAAETGGYTTDPGTLLFKPRYLTVSSTAACGTFSYASQPFTASVRAFNAQNSITSNYDGSANTSPNFAKAVTLSDASGNSQGALMGTALAATAFSGGTATASALSFAFTNKLTAPQSITLRATDADAVSSSGYAEGSMALRSGRLRLSNAFGKASAALQVPVVVEYWSNLSWVPTSDDTCTVIPSASVALSNPRSQTGAVSAATSSASAGTLTTGRGVLTLTAPNPAGSSLTLDLSINLGATTTDQSCNPSSPTSVAGNLPWLRSRNGSCAATWDRDPAARASFGIFSPETRKTIHLREIF